MKLELPTSEQLTPWLSKLQTNTGSVVILSIELPSPTAAPIIKWGWLSTDEREALRKGLVKLNKQRKLRGEAETTAKPTAVNVERAEGQ